jgi:hypothetical protein
MVLLYTKRVVIALMGLW